MWIRLMSAASVWVLPNIRLISTFSTLKCRRLIIKIIIKLFIILRSVSSSYFRWWKFQTRNKYSLRLCLHKLLPSKTTPSPIHEVYPSLGIRILGIICDDLGGVEGREVCCISSEMHDIKTSSVGVAGLLYWMMPTAASSTDLQSTPK